MTNQLYDPHNNNVRTLAVTMKNGKTVTLRWTVQALQKALSEKPLQINKSTAKTLHNS